jgi:hypothetical protein
VAADRPPQLTTSSTRTVASRGTLALLAQATDPDGDAVAFLWTQLSGPPVVLVGADTAGASFVAPSVGVATPVRLQVAATANGLSAQSEVEVMVQAEGTPVADAGPDVTVPGRSPVALEGTGSFPDGSAVSFSWTQVAGPVVTLAGATSAAPSFLSPDVKLPAVLTFRLSVSAHGLSAEDTVDVAVLADQPPVASAGADQDVLAGAHVLLAVSGSDPEGDTLAFAWSQVSGPPVTLAGDTSPVASFDVPAELGNEPVIEWTFEVVATANGLSSAPARVQVRAHRVNRVPVVTGPNVVTADERTSVQLDAAAVDPDGDAVTWTWEQVGGPAVVLTGQGSPSVSFGVPEVASDLALAFVVVASDGAGAVGRADVRVEVRNVNRAPVASITGPAEVQSGEPVLLSGAGTLDPDGDALTWSWVQLSGPAVDVSGLSTPVLAFRAPSVDADMELAFELTATDGSGASATARHAWVVHPAPPVEAKPRSGCGCAAGGADVPLTLLGWVVAAAWSRRRKEATWG